MSDVVSYTLATLQAGIIAETEEDATYSAAFVAELPMLVRKGESRLYGDLNFEIFDRVVTGALTIGSYEQAVKTAAWQGTRSLAIRLNNTLRWTFLLQRSRDYCMEYEPLETNTAKPKYYAELSETEYFLSPPPDVAYEFELHEITNNNTQSLVSVSPTWLSTNGGDVLFAAVLVEAKKWLQDSDADIAAAEATYQQKMTTFRATHRTLIRTDQAPLQNAPRTVEDKP